MTTIEDALRQAFADRVEEAFRDGAGAVPDDVTDLVIRRAGRQRRRRAIGMSITGAMVIAVAGVLALPMTGFQPGSAPQSDGGGAADLLVADEDVIPDADRARVASSVPEATRQLEVVSGGEIFTQTNHRLQLPDKRGAAEITYAYRAGDDYLVITSIPAQSGVRLVQVDRAGGTKILIEEARTIVVSGDGGRIAWQAGEVTFMAARVGATLTRRVSERLPQNAIPVGLSGPSLVLARGDRVTPDAHDLWYSAGERYLETWDPTVVRYLDTPRGGGGFYALVTSPEGENLCLALLTLGQPFLVLKRTCGMPLPARGARVSPDGRWLAYPTAEVNELVMLDLSTAFDQATASTLVWKLPAFGQRMVWLTPNTFVVDTGERFLTLHPSRPGKLESIGPSKGRVLVEPLHP